MFTQTGVKSLSQNTFLTHTLPAIGAVLVIFGLSSIPRLTGPDLHIPYVDKLYHMIEYGGVAGAVARAFRANLGEGSRWKRTTILVMILVASLDELYQSFIPGRFSDPTDFAADIVGTVIGICIFDWVRRRWPLLG